MRCNFNSPVLQSPTPCSPQVHTGAWRKKKKESLSSFSPTISKVTIFGVAKHVCSRLGFAFISRNPTDVCGNILHKRNCSIIVSLLKHSVTYGYLYSEAPQFSFESVDAVMWLKGDTFWELVAGCHPLSVKSALQNRTAIGITYLTRSD